MKDRIQALVSQGKLKEAILLLPPNISAQQLGRLSNLERKERLGTIDFGPASQERNKITLAVLDLAGIDSKSTQPAKVAQPSTTKPEVLLTRIIIQNKRRRKDIAEEAQTILSDLRAYKDQKTTNPTFDPSSRRYRVIEKRITDLQAKLQVAKEDSIEDIVGRIDELINKDDVPTYDQLKKAYELCVGRGMKSTTVSDILERMPDDNEAKITVAEEIELFMATIQVV